MGVRKVTRENTGEVHVPALVMRWLVSGVLSPLEFQIWALLVWAAPNVVAVDFLTQILTASSCEVSTCLRLLQDRRMAATGARRGVVGWIVQPDATAYRKPGI